MHRYLHDMKHSNIIPILDYFYSLFGNFNKFCVIIFAMQYKHDR